MKEIKNVTDLRKMLCETILLLQSGKIDAHVATETSNAAGKIVQTAKLEMDYARMRKETPKIQFME